MSITVRTNLPEFKSKLKQIGADMEKKSVRSAALAGAKVFSNIARQEAPIRKTRKVIAGQVIPPGVLKKAIAPVSKRRLPRGVVAYMVIPRSGKRSRKGKSSLASRDAFYWAWVEKGHVIARSKLKGGNRSRSLQRERMKAAGQMTKPNPYLRRAWTKGQAPALKAFYDSLEKSFVKYSAL